MSVASAVVGALSVNHAQAPASRTIAIHTIGQQVPISDPTYSFAEVYVLTNGGANALAFSPDGRFLALQLSFGDNSYNGQMAVQLELVSTGSDRLTVIPQTWVSSQAMAGFGWPVGNDTLVAELTFTTKVQLASWRPGASQLAIAALTPRHSLVSLVMGQYAL